MWARFEQPSRPAAAKSPPSKQGHFQALQFRKSLASQSWSMAHSHQIPILTTAGPELSRTGLGAENKADLPKTSLALARLQTPSSAMLTVMNFLEIQRVQLRQTEWSTRTMMTMTN